MRRLIAVTLVLTVVGSAHGQTLSGLHVGLSRPNKVMVMSQTTGNQRVEERRSYWLEGTILGGALGLVGGLQLQHQICGQNECTSSDHFWFVTSALVLTVLGGLIGSAIHKS